MRGAIRKKKKIAYAIQKYAPYWFVQWIVYLKGTGTLTTPHMTEVKNRHSLQCTIARNSYGTFCTPDSCKYDEPVQSVYRGEQYEADTIEYIRRLELPGDIVHAGAYFGDTLPALATCIEAGAHIWAFEPNIESYRCAKITLLLNDLNMVTLQNIGLGNKNETAFLQTYSSTDSKIVTLGGASCILDAPTDNTQEVQIKKLDDILPMDRCISLLHLDVEGFESDVLAGAREVIKKWKPIIIVEVNNDEIYSTMEKIGYVFEVGLEPRKWRDGYRNAVFKKKKK